MDERCKECPLICKRLDGDDFPLRYAFAGLTPKQLINLVEDSVTRFAPWHHLKIERSAQSDGDRAGDQLAVVFSVRYLPADADNQLVLIAQSAMTLDGHAELWFRFGVPNNCCQQAATRGLSTMVAEVLEQIGQSEWLLSRAGRHERDK